MKNKTYKIVAGVVAWTVRIILSIFIIAIIVSSAPFLAWLSLSGPLLISIGFVMPAYFKNDEQQIRKSVKYLFYTLLIFLGLTLISVIEYFVGYDPTGIINKLINY